MDKVYSGTYLITGATGFLGRNLVKELLIYGKNIQVIAQVRNLHKAREIFGNDNKNLIIHVGDIKSVNERVSKIDYIIHSATVMDSNSYKNVPYTSMQTNLLMMNQVIELALQVNAMKVVYISSAVVYGDRLNQKVTEGMCGGTHSMDVRNAYEESKRFCEYLCASAIEQFGLDISTVRLFTVYGRDVNLNANSIFTNLLKNALECKNLVIKGDGKPIRNWCYITDAVRGIMVICQNGKSGEAYNVGSDTENYSIKEFAEVLSQLTGEKMIIEGETTWQSIQIPDLSKINALGYHSEIKLRDGLKRCLGLE